MTIKRAREILGKRGEKISDQEVTKIINLLTKLVNKTIDDVVLSKSFEL